MNIVSHEAKNTLLNFMINTLSLKLACEVTFFTLTFPIFPKILEINWFFYYRVQKDTFISLFKVSFHAKEEKGQHCIFYQPGI